MNGSGDEQCTDEETARRRDAALLRALNTPPKPHKDMKLGKSKPKASAKANPLKNRRVSSSEIIFDMSSFDEDLKRLGALAFENFLKTRGSVLIDLSYDIFVSKCVPADTTGAPGKVVYGLRIIGNVK